MSALLVLILFLFAPVLAMALAGAALLSVRAVRGALRLLAAAATRPAVGVAAR